MPLLFAAALFSSALTLFILEPLVGKMLLPYLGGSPAVWNTCMVFFQAALLAGYVYAHAVTDRLPPRRQVLVHAAVLLLPLAGFAALAAVTGGPVGVVKALVPQGQEYPIFGVLAVLTLSVGLPFFAVSATAPLLQKWFAGTGHPAAADPYFLYAASNLGSLLALLAYPTVIEPAVGLSAQSWAWAAAYLGTAALIGSCGVALLRAPVPVTHPATADDPVEVRVAELAKARTAAYAETVAPNKAKRKKGKRPRPGEVPDGPPADPNVVTRATRLRWAALAAVPSSLMLGVTSYMTTDVASIPLLWVIPLAVYLATFIIAFSRVPPGFHLATALLTPVFLLLLVFLLTSGTKPKFTVLLGLHLLTFAFVGLTLHGELARTRPPAEKLTEFYLWVSLGGVLGGLFNSLIAPVAFPSTWEYPFALVAACLLLPPLTQRQPAVRLTSFLDGALPVVVSLLAFSLALSWTVRPRIEPYHNFVGKLASLTGARADSLGSVVTYGVPAMLCYFLVERPVRFGLAVALVLFAGPAAEQFIDKASAANDPSLLLRHRSFFGVLKLEQDSEFRKLVHGTTLHGKQRRGVSGPIAPVMAAAPLQALAVGADPFGRAALVDAAWEFWAPPSQVPLTYYHRRGPVGDVVAAAGGARLRDFAVVGMGTGSIAAYCRPGQHLTYYEIDPAVVRIAENPEYLTFLPECRGKYSTVLGDARLMLEKTDAKYGVIFVDAFSSDAIPVHLLTREAVELYFDRVGPDGLVALHISNRYLDLEQVAQRIAADLKLEARVRDDSSGGDEQSDADFELYGRTGATWVVLARRADDLGPLAANKNWRQLEVKPTAPLWTDDYSNVWRVWYRK